MPAETYDWKALYEERLAEFDRVRAEMLANLPRDQRRAWLRREQKRVLALRRALAQPTPPAWLRRRAEALAADINHHIEHDASTNPNTGDADQADAGS